MPGLTEAQVQRYIALLQKQIEEEMATRQTLKNKGDLDLACNHKMFANAFTRALNMFREILAHPGGGGYYDEK